MNGFVMGFEIQRGRWAPNDPAWFLQLHRFGWHLQLELNLQEFAVGVCLSFRRCYAGFQVGPVVVSVGRTEKTTS